MKIICMIEDRPHAENIEISFRCWGKGPKILLLLYLPEYETNEQMVQI